MKALAGTLIALGPVGLFLLATLDGMGVPLPGGVDFLLVLLTAAHPEQAWFLASLAIIGSIGGGMLLYRIGHKGGEAFLERRTQTGRGARFKVWFRKYGLLTVFIPAFFIIPLPLKLFVLCAGAMGVGWRPVLLTLIAARVPRYLGLAWLASHYGKEAWPWVKAHGWHMGALAAVIFLMLFAVVRLADRKARESD